MALAKFIQDGTSIDYTPSAAVAAGTIVTQNSLVGVAKQPIAANTLGALAVEGIFIVPKKTGTGEAILVGGDAYWDAENGVAVNTSGSGIVPLGKAVAAAGDSDATVRVRLSM